MLSPFPGMNPFLESQEWEDFHARLNTTISDLLGPLIDPNYFVRVERRIYVEHVGEDFISTRRADVAILSQDFERTTGRNTDTTTSGGSAIECLLAMPIERRETYLVIRERTTMQVVTVIELLSPANKRSGSDGRREYLSKRDEILSSASHLVELDLLRGGLRLPMADSLPPGDYYAIVSRSNRRPRASVYAWTLPQTLPTIPIPLKVGDADVTLSLQQAVTSVYQHARYNLSIDYTRDLDPPLDVPL